MASKSFSRSDWEKIRKTLDADPNRFGLPERVYGSVVLASFNIRKLGSPARRDANTWRFLADVCRHFDLLAVQEIQDDLLGLQKLKEKMGPEYGLIVSDATGAFPGERGAIERLGFLFNWSLVNRTEVATDITYDRSKVVGTIYDNNAEIQKAFEEHDAKLKRYAKELKKYKSGKRKSKPSKPLVKWPVFISFIRSPYCVSFEVSGHPGTPPYQFMAINAHLYYGNTMDDRRQEFDALMEWIRSRVKANDKAYYPNFILLGDLNLDFDNPKKDRKRIEKHLKTFNDASGAAVTVNFPFLDKHKGQRTFFRTNARLTETFDQIGLFCRDKRFPAYDLNAAMGSEPRGPDYGMFDFVNLFSKALNGKSRSQLTEAEEEKFFSRFEHKVSDHMPIWLRLPLP
jgi:endonuclease/exonuclease/phosphatase family metal-dependent hydrolase